MEEGSQPQEKVNRTHLILYPNPKQGWYTGEVCRAA